MSCAMLCTLVAGVQRLLPIVPPNTSLPVVRPSAFASPLIFRQADPHNVISAPLFLLPQFDLDKGEEVTDAMLRQLSAMRLTSLSLPSLAKVGPRSPDLSSLCLAFVSAHVCSTPCVWDAAAPSTDCRKGTLCCQKLLRAAGKLA